MQNKATFLKMLLVSAGLLAGSLGSNAQSAALNLPVCNGFKTFTQGGWGANPNGNNPGVYLTANFATAFPAGLTIGCTNSLKLMTAQAVTAFLPSGSTATSLPSGVLTNPGGSYNNVLAGQLVAATLSAQFDETFANFASATTNLKDLIIGSGTFQGWTVSQVLAEANKKIGGCSSSYSFSQFNTVLTNINENYVNGTTNGNFLRCPTIGISNILGNVSCFGGNNGSITLTISGGNAPYTYLWSNGATTKDIGGLTAGTYTITIKDANGQNKVVSFTITQPLSALASTYTQVNVNCFGASTGSIDLSVSGGTAPYSYLWTGGVTTEDRSGLAAGSYNVVITDARGCIRNVSAIITGPSAGISADAVASPVDCFGNANGSINLTVSGGTSPYTYVWSNNATTEDLSNVAAGSYSVLITDAKSCTTSAGASIGQPAALQLSLSVTPSLECLCNGTASAFSMGGSLPYSYSWSNGTNGTDRLEGICAGTQTSVVVTDAKGCQKTSENITTVYRAGCTGFSVESYFQGKRNNNTPVLADRSNPLKVLGIPDWSNTAGGFFSLGFGGHIIIKMDGGLVDAPGNDLRISETTFDSPNPRSCTAYPERARIFVSQNLLAWYDLGEICQDGEVDIAPLSCIMYVKIVDVTNPLAFGNQIVDGYDVDGIQCINGATAGARLSLPAGNSIAAVQSGQAHLDLFPNPVEDRLSVTIGGFTEGQDLTVMIFDMLGKEVRSMSVRPNATTYTMELESESLTSGVYFVSVKGDNYSQTKKFVRK